MDITDKMFMESIGSVRQRPPGWKFLETPTMYTMEITAKQINPLSLGRPYADGIFKEALGCTPMEATYYMFYEIWKRRPHQLYLGSKLCCTYYSMTTLIFFEFTVDK